MLATRQPPSWHFLLGLCVLMPFHLAQSRDKEKVEDDASGLRLDSSTETPKEHGGAQSLQPNFCDFTFHIPLSGHFCTPASQEELDHLKVLLEDTKSILKSVQDAAALEAGPSNYQDIVSEVLPGVREANVGFHEVLGKFLQELEENIQEDDRPRVEDEHKRLKEHLRAMDNLLQLTGHLAERLDQTSQSLLETLTRPAGKPLPLVHGGVLQPS